LPKNQDLGFVATKWSTEKRLHKFTEDWNNTLKVMRAIAARVAAPGVKPRWIDGSVATGAQADQFLHACYYKQAKNGNRYSFKEFFVRNSKNLEPAL
jgi:predicted N-acyltransferase